MRTIVTGASGYIGLHIVRELLEHGHPVTAVVRRPDSLGPLARRAGLTVVQADLERDTLARALPGHAALVHAALIWNAPGSELQLRDTAVCARLFDGAARAGLTRCIYLSSAAVHRPFSGEMDEEDSLRTADVYGATKAAGELFLRAACARAPMTGVVLRPGPVVGPAAFPGGACRAPRRIAEMASAACVGRRIEVARGEGRQLSDVSTVARAVGLLLRAEDPHPTYLCMDRDIFTWEQVARMVVASMGSPSPIHVVARAGPDPEPRFRTDRIEELLGGSSDATGALAALLRELRLDTSRPS